jgi:uncharacterized membrane protein YkvA (DUF1232 family)
MMQRLSKDLSRHYSEHGLWTKLRHFASAAGKGVVESVLLLYYSASDPATPARARAIAWSALGYFILPPDFIPDFTPGIGFSDDLGVIAVALGVIAAHIKPRHKAAAQARLRDWFGPRVATQSRATADESGRR